MDHFTKSMDIFTAGMYKQLYKTQRGAAFQEILLKDITIRPSYEWPWYP